MALAPPLDALIATKLAHAAAPPWELPIAEVRAGFAKLWDARMTGGPVAVAAVEDRAAPTRAGAVPVRLYRPEAGVRPVLVHCHGGGWVKGGIAETDAFCRRLARATGRLVVSVGYRLAPEHPFPAPLEDAWDAARWAFAQAEALGGTRQGFAMAGESAGGNMAAGVCLMARDRGDPRIAAQVLLQPWLDLTLGFPSVAMPETECLVPRADLAWYRRTYAGPDADFRDPRLSPLWAPDLSGLPPALIVAAGQDTLRDEAEAFAGKLAEAGTPATYACYPGMVHGFLQMAGLVPEAREAIELVARFLGDHAPSRPGT